ncbi:hypothetical protein DPX16_22169 [Anabarilius grahami]|uniref:Uncharacterized protein n=1 Tax=Anabarilius grahami TaxID=495550 RepID=A0A3N0XNI1_ANAGA|nr:hypothetical protein DPX16_22169 [Anabarilius grahami]
MRESWKRDGAGDLWRRWSTHTQTRNTRGDRESQETGCPALTPVNVIREEMLLQEGGEVILSKDPMGTKIQNNAEGNVFGKERRETPYQISIQIEKNYDALGKALHVFQ